MSKLIVILCSLLLSEGLFANVLWSSKGSTPPRHRNITTESDAPCGSGEKATPVQLYSGTNTELEWEEFIPQNGYFEIYFSPANDENWILLKKINNNVMGESTDLKVHKVNIKLPDVSCDNCTIQIIQTVTGTVDAKYYSCADISLKGAPNNNTVKTESCAN
ncbi:MAG: lytic polysaccharide monooxygenase [Bdellovibrionales bacterium]|nr:lytic polysaccharide monooxygenase [Bdellovibrionales bacterium]